MAFSGLNSPQTGNPGTRPEPLPQSSPMGGQEPSPDMAQSQDANRQFVAMVRDVSDRIQTMARMRPVMAPFARQATQLLIKGMTEAIGRGPQQPPAPGEMPQAVA